MPAPSQKAREWVIGQLPRATPKTIKVASEGDEATNLDSFTLELREALKEAILEVEHLNESETVKTQSWRSVADAHTPEEEKG